MDKKINIKNIVAFCILMQNGNGILAKSPDYILEKFKRYCTESATEEEYKWGLHPLLVEELELWSERWLKEKK